MQYSLEPPAALVHALGDIILSCMICMLATVISIHSLIIKCAKNNEKAIIPCYHGHSKLLSVQPIQLINNSLGVSHAFLSYAIC